MKAIILAAGEGVRMRPLTLITPKPLLIFAGKTLLDHVFDSLSSEINEVLVVVKYLGDKIKNYLGGEYKGRKIKYVEGSEKGNAASFLACYPHLKDEGRFLVIHGDEPQRKEEIEECLRHPYSCVCAEFDDSKLSGVATVGKDGRILEIVEKPETPKSHWVAMGTMVVDKDIFKYQQLKHANGEFYFSSMMDQFSKDHHVQMVQGRVRPRFDSLDDLSWEWA